MNTKNQIQSNGRSPAKYFTRRVRNHQKFAALVLAGIFAFTLAAGATSYTWNVTSGNWSTTNSWTPNTGAGGPSATDSVTFGVNDTSSSSSTVNNIVDSGFAGTITGLTYNSTSAAAYHVTQIQSPQVLTVTGPVLVGGVNGVSSLVTTEAYMTGTGTFKATGSTFTVQNYDNTTGASATAYLNLSGLSTFIYSNSTGTISIEDNAGSNTRLGGNMTLAGTSNFITAANFNLGTSTAQQAGPAGTLTLGPGTNIINVASFNIGAQKSTYTVANTGGGLKIRGVSGADTDRPPITIGNRNVTGGSGTASGSVLLNGCAVNIKASTLTVGESTQTGAPNSSGESGVGVLQFDTGVVDATSVVIGYDDTAEYSATVFGTATGTISVGANGATLIVGTGGLSLVNQVTNSPATGTLNIASGGTVTNNGSITRNSTNGTANLNVGGTLSLASNCFVGTVVFPINNVTLTNGATLFFADPSSTQTNMVAGTLTWPSTDSGLTFAVGSLPDTVMVGSTFPLLGFATMSGGTFTAPVATLPAGFGGSLSVIGNTVTLTISSTPPPPSVPANVNATAGNAQVGLTWSPSTGTAGAITYQIARSTNSGGEMVVATGITTTNFTDTNLLNEVTYYYVVYAVNNGVASAASTEVSAMPLGAPPVPAALVASLEAGDLPVLTWIDIDGMTYNILRATSLSGPYTNIATGVTGTTYTDTSAVLGVSFYYYEVVAVNGGYSSAASSPLTVPYGQGNQLVNPSFELGTTNWTLVNNAIGNTSVNSTNNTYDNSGSGECPQDMVTLHVVAHTGTNVGKIYGSFNTYPNTSGFEQQFAAGPGGTWAAGGWTYASHEDLSGVNSIYYEVDFLNVSGAVLASYESYDVKNLLCGETAPFPVDAWVFLGVTNQMQVTNGTNSGVVIGNTGASGVLTAPSNTVSVRFQALFVQTNGADGGSIFLDDAELDFISGPVPPSLSAIPINGITLCTNKALTCTAQSSTNTIAITNVQIISQTSALGVPGSTTVTNGLGSSPLSVTGIGTTTANISFALTTNLFYDVTVIVTDGNGISSSTSASFDTLAPVLVIEGSDFNFSNGQFIDTPPNGGLALYTNQVGVQGTDENKATNRVAVKSYYRTNDAVIIQAADSISYTEQKFVTAAANGDTTDVELEVGYNSGGDWLNYSRTFGSAPGDSAPAGTYSIWLYSGTQGTNTQSRLYQVTSDPTQSNQTTNLLGAFGNAAYTNTSYFNYEYLPLVDANSNVVAVSLSGIETFKSVVVGNPNIAFYMLTPAVTPSLQSSYPSNVFEATNQFSFTIASNSGASILTNGISLTINGVNVTSGLSFAPSGGGWTASYPYLLPNSTYTAVVYATNTAGFGIAHPVTFDTFDINNYQWEAVDYDFSTNNGTIWIGGQFIDNPVPTCDVTAPESGTFATNSYFGFPTGFLPENDPYGYGAIAQQGIDIYFPNTQLGSNEYYRADGVGSQPATDYLRPKFIAAQTEFGDQNIGLLNIGYFNTNDWLNYTRTYPAGTYNIYGRLAGLNPFSNTVVSVVTSGVGTSNQTTSVLGSFADANPAGYQVYHWIPLLDTNKNKVAVTLGGKETLRVTSGNGLNLEFFMLVPEYAISASVVGGELYLSFPTETGFTYALMYKSSLSAPNWTQVGSSFTGDGTQVVVKPASGFQGYYTVVLQ